MSRRVIFDLGGLALAKFSVLSSGLNLQSKGDGMLKQLWPLFFSLTVFQSTFADEIHDAVKNGDEEKMRELLDSGKAHVNDKDDLGRTPLHWASMNEQDSGLASILVMDYEADPKVRDNRGTLPSHFAASNGNIITLGNLLRYGAALDAKADPINSEWLPLDGQPATSAYSQGIFIYPYICEEINAIDGQGRTLLHLATYYGHKEAVEYLLVWFGGINRNLEDNDGNTPLEIALEKGYEEIIDILRPHSIRYSMWCDLKRIR